MFSKLLCTNGTIVFSKDLDGLAIEMSKWMIKERGVKRIVLMAQKTIEELNENITQLQDWKFLQLIAQEYKSFVELVKVDVTKFDQVFDVIHRINLTEYPVRGIIHTAMVFHDTLVKNMTQDMLTNVMRSKIRGAWNLHHAAEMTKSSIDFFVMFSSIQNHYLSEIGQSNYNAGNAFLDALAHWRFNCKKLPALSISLPAISAGGFIHKNTESAQSLGDYTVPASYMFKMIEQFYMKQQMSSTVIAPVIFLNNWNEALKRRNLPKSLIRIAEEFVCIKTTEELSNHRNTNSITEMDSKNILEKIHTTVSVLFGSSSVDRVHADKSLIQQGMDSLVAVELHNWLGKHMNISLSVIEILRGMSINDIANYVSSKLLKGNNNSNNNSTLSIIGEKNEIDH